MIAARRTLAEPGIVALATPTVLIVEDDDDIREVLAVVAERAGLEPVTVADGAAALAYLRRHDTPTLLLLDLMMPVMDGRELLRRLDGRLRDLPVVVLTAGPTDGLPAHVTALRKPITMELLLDAITTAARCRSSPA